MNRLVVFLLTAALISSPDAMAAATAAGDEIYLRNGEVWTGTIFQESTTDYSFIPAGSGGTLRRIPRDAVRYVLYADAVKADRALGLGAARRLCKESGTVPVQILTAEGMGQAILDVARNAQTSVWISGYAFSSSLSGSIGAFYAVLASKVKEGVEVVIMAEYGQATPPSVKQSTRNFVTEMARHGMRVYLLGERKALHKKLLIVDRRVVFLGSSNLTSAGTLYNQDLNLRVECPAFARQVISDFERIRQRAIPLEKWND